MMRVWDLPSDSRFPSAKDVEKTFHLKSQAQGTPKSSPKTTSWSLKYPEGTTHTWTEQPMAPEPDELAAKNWGRFANPLKARGPKAIEDWDKRFSIGEDAWKLGCSDRAHYEAVFNSWKSDHRLNYEHDCEYATIPYLMESEMKCALEGHWVGLSHMLQVPKGKTPEQYVMGKRLGDMKAIPDYKWEWFLARKVFRLKQKHGEWRMSLMEEYLQATETEEGLDEDETATLFALANKSAIERESRIAHDSEAALTASPTPIPAPAPTKRKRAGKKAETAPMAQSNGEEIRRSKRARVSTVPFASLNATPTPHQRRSPIGSRSPTIASSPSDDTPPVAATITTPITPTVETPCSADLPKPLRLSLFIRFAEPPSLRVGPRSS